VHIHKAESRDQRQVFCEHSNEHVDSINYGYFLNFWHLLASQERLLSGVSGINLPVLQTENIANLQQQYHNSKLVIFQEKLLKVL